MTCCRTGHVVRWRIMQHPWPGKLRVLRLVLLAAVVLYQARISACTFRLERYAVDRGAGGNKSEVRQRIALRPTAARPMALDRRLTLAMLRDGVMVLAYRMDPFETWLRPRFCGKCSADAAFIAAPKTDSRLVHDISLCRT